MTAASAIPLQTIALEMFIVATVISCFATIIGMFVLRRRIDPLLQVSGFLTLMGVLCLIVPVTLVGRARPIAVGALFIMMVPVFPVLMFLGLSCFLFWSVRSLFASCRKRFRPTSV
jgi:hypothetical protein